MSTYSSSPRCDPLLFGCVTFLIRSRSRTPEGDKNHPLRVMDEENGKEERMDKKSSLSPQTGRHDGEDLFHPAASPVNDS